MNRRWTQDPYVVAFPEHLPFWQAAARQELLLPLCRDCGEWHWYPRPHCPFCRSNAVEWQEAVGAATLHTWTLVQRPQGEIVLAYVRLREGPLMLTRLIDVATDALAIDMPLGVAFETAPEGRHAPVFRPQTWPAALPLTADRTSPWRGR